MSGSEGRASVGAVVVLGVMWDGSLARVECSRGRYGRRLEARSVGRKLGVASFLVLLEGTMYCAAAAGRHWKYRIGTDMMMQNTVQSHM